MNSKRINEQIASKNLNMKSECNGYNEPVLGHALNRAEEKNFLQFVQAKFEIRNFKVIIGVIFRNDLFEAKNRPIQYHKT